MRAREHGGEFGPWGSGESAIEKTVKTSGFDLTGIDILTAARWPRYFFPAGAIDRCGKRNGGV